MLRAEQYNERLICHFSDEGKKLRQVETGRIYTKPVYDEIPCRYTYEEVEEEATNEDFKAALESLGVNFNV